MKRLRPIESATPKQTGWTLVELLVAMTLTLLLIAGVGQIYLAAKRSYDIQNRLARLQDAGRYTTELLTQDIHRAGYWGMMDMRLQNSVPAMSPPAPPGTRYPTGLPGTPTGLLGSNLADNSCPPGTTEWGGTVTQRLFGLNNPASNPASYRCITGNLEDRDVLVVRYADARPPSFGNPRLYIRSAPYQASLVIGNPAACPPGTAGCALFNYVNAPLPAGVNADFEVIAHAYYVGNSLQAKECGAEAGNALPALQREELDTGGQPVRNELITGVEHLQFQYGVDTDADGSVNQYLDAGAVTNWQAVRAVRFWVLVRDDCPDASYTDPNTYNMGDIPYTPGDGFHRALYTATVALRD